MLNTEDTEPEHSMVLSITEPLWLHRRGYFLLKQISEKKMAQTRKLCNVHERDFSPVVKYVFLCVYTVFLIYIFIYDCPLCLVVFECQVCSTHLRNHCQP